MTQFIALFLDYFPRVPPGWQAAVLGFCLLAFCLGWLGGRREANGARIARALSLSALLGYAFFLLVMLVLTRRTQRSPSVILDPLYSYRKILARTPGSFEWFCLDVFNCLLYLPLGVFCAAWRQSRRAPGRSSALRAALLGLALSLLVEALQFTLRRGVCELGDLLHNSLGALLGALLWLGASRLVRRKNHD